MNNKETILIERMDLLQEKQERKSEKSELIFTRYLYIKDEVELALVTSLLTKNEKSLFWAYELYYSGFNKELFILLWQIYYDFYASLNPTFWEYMTKKEKEKNKDKDNESQIIASIISNLLIRNCNLDGFLLRHQTKYNKNAKGISDNILYWLKNNNITSLSEYILYSCDLCNLQLTLNIILEHFKYSDVDTLKEQKKWTKAIHHSSINPRSHLLSILLSILSVNKGYKLSRNMYVIVDSSKLEEYKTIVITPKFNRAYKILEKAYKYAIDEDDYLSLFMLNRDTLSSTLTNIYYYHWEYYASFSPIWNKRITDLHGIINNETKTILFKEETSDTDNNEQLFYEQFGYEPDEQAREIQQKSIQPIRQLRSWATFYDSFKNNGIYDIELDVIQSWTKIKYM